MLLVIQPLKKYLTEHEPETLSTCHDKHLVSCQDAQRPLSKTASFPEGKCILLLHRILLSTVQQWGNSDYGYVKFPIAFTAFRRILLTHQGSAFMIAKFAEYIDNNGFTLSVADLNGGVNAAESYDAQYLAIGK